MRRRRIATGALALLLALHSAALGDAADARRALDAVAKAIAQTQNGDHAGARKTLLEISPIVKTELTAIDAFDSRAGAAWTRCVGAVAELDRNIGQIATTEDKVTRALGETQRSLDTAVQDGNVLASEIADIEQKMTRLNASLQERQAKLRELEQWFWVPGYGMYLGIRTLAQDDIGQLNALARSLHEQRVLGRRSEQALALARTTTARLANEQSRLAAEKAVAVSLRADLDKRMTQVRAVTDFIGQAKLFWGDVRSLTENQVQGALQRTTIFANKLGYLMGQPGPSALVLGIGREQANLRNKLAELAVKLEQGSGYTALAATDCAPSANSRQPACQITVKWPHYEIVDPAKCSFRYVNPPGCPPGVARPPAPGQTMELAIMRAQKASVLSRVAKETNWIGLARCKSPNALYFGKLASPADCAQACLGNDDCVAWTFNYSNGMIDGTTTECWGGTRNLTLTTDEWGGFVSGGVPCASSSQCQ
jgi:hypothetical protein